MAESRHLVYMDAKSNKFWKIELEGSSFTVTYGRVGSDGQSSAKDFPTPEKAKAEYNKLVAEKLGKGYVDAASNAAPSAGDGDQIPALAFVSIVSKEEIYNNASQFIGKRVVDFDPEKDASGDRVYRFRSDYDEPEKLIEGLAAFFETDAAASARAIVIGLWTDDSSTSSQEVVEYLAANKDKLPNLAAIYLGDVTSEECEISWLVQCDMAPLLEAFPKLQFLRIRGGSELKISKPAHKTLRALAIEAGGLPVEVVRSICMGDFPNLEHLELWLGTDEYGGTSTVEDLQPILSGRLFPKLKYLGLRNSTFTDEIASVIVNSPIIQRIETLDLSLGTLTDEGGKALLALPEGGTLRAVNLHHNFLSKKVAGELKAKQLAVNVSNPSHHDMDDEFRFIAVSE